MAGTQKSGNPESPPARQPDDEKPNEPTVTEGRARAAASASVGEPFAHEDNVAMVSIDKNGEPDQAKGFNVLVDDDAPKEEKDAAHNKAGIEAAKGSSS